MKMTSRDFETFSIKLSNPQKTYLDQKNMFLAFIEPILGQNQVKSSTQVPNPEWRSSQSFL